MQNGTLQRFLLYYIFFKKQHQALIRYGGMYVYFEQLLYSSDAMIQVVVKWPQGTVDWHCSGNLQHAFPRITDSFHGDTNTDICSSYEILRCFKQRFLFCSHYSYYCDWVQIRHKELNLQQFLNNSTILNVCPFVPIL